MENFFISLYVFLGLITAGLLSNEAAGNKKVEGGWREEGEMEKERDRERKTVRDNDREYLALPG